MLFTRQRSLPFSQSTLSSPPVALSPSSKRNRSNETKTSVVQLAATPTRFLPGAASREDDGPRGVGGSLVPVGSTPIARKRAAAKPIGAGSRHGAAAAEMVRFEAGCSAAPGSTFARKRIEHAVELFGACMLIALALTMALFA